MQKLIVVMEENVPTLRRAAACCLNIAKPFWDFKPRGETGKMVSDLLPNLANQVDDFCFFHSPLRYRLGYRMND